VNIRAVLHASAAIEALTKSSGACSAARRLTLRPDNLTAGDEGYRASMKTIVFLLAVVGCSHAYDRNFAGIDGLLSDTQRNDSAVAAAQELELQIKFDTSNGLRSDERFAPTRDRVLAALDTAARARPAEAAVILAKKAELLGVLGRDGDAKTAFAAALAAPPSFEGFQLLSAKLDGAALLHECTRTRPVVTNDEQVCYVLGHCGVVIHQPGGTFTKDSKPESQLDIFASERFTFPDGMSDDDKTRAVTCEYQARVAYAHAEDRDRAARANECIAGCLHSYAICPSQPESCVGDFRRCDASCSN
jgi:hypothetical protein